MQILRGVAAEWPEVKLWNRHALSEISKIGGLGWRTIVGSFTTVADKLKILVEEGDVDGFSQGPSLPAHSLGDRVPHS